MCPALLMQKIVTIFSLPVLTTYIQDGYSWNAIRTILKCDIALLFSTESFRQVNLYTFAPTFFSQNVGAFYECLSAFRKS